MRRARVPVWFGCVGAILAAPADARASDDAGAYLTPGFLWAPSVQAGRAPGVGLELGSAIYPKGCCYAWGPVAEAEVLPAQGQRLTAYRGALGVQGMWGPLGVDVGWALRSDAGPLVPWASGPQLGAFFSLGFLSVGVRTLVPVAHGDTGVATGEVGLVLTLKAMVLVYGESPSFLGALGLGNLGRMPSGRPLFVDAIARVARTRVRRDWQRSDGPSVRARVPLAESMAARIARAAQGK